MKWRRDKLKRIFALALSVVLAGTSADFSVLAAENAEVGETGQLVVFATAPSGLSVYRVLDLKVVE